MIANETLDTKKNYMKSFDKVYFPGNLINGSFLCIP